MASSSLGIRAFDADHVYQANQAIGITLIDVPTGDAAPMSFVSGMSVLGIDRLYCHDETPIGIQNVVEGLFDCFERVPRRIELRKIR